MFAVLFLATCMASILFLSLSNPKTLNPLLANSKPKGHNGRIWEVDISADGEYIVIGTEEGKVYLFDKDSSTPIWTYELPEGQWTN